MSNAQEKSRRALADAERLLTDGSPGASAEWIEAAQAYVDQLRETVGRADADARRARQATRASRRSMRVPRSLTLRLHGR